MPERLSQIVESSAERFPDRVAFRCGASDLTYAELLTRANQLANTLIDLGVQPGDRVGIYLPKSLETAISVYGILRAGAAYVPIDPAAPKDRVDMILRDCGIRHLVTRPEKARAVEQLEVPLHAVVGSTDASWETVARQSPEPVPPPGADLAYILYTSGSTGKPKGLAHTHASGMSYVRLSAETYGVTSSDRLGNHAPLHFDISTFDFLTGPSVGATTVIIPEEVLFFPESLAALIEKERLTIWYSVPLALIQLLEQTDLSQRDLSALRWVMTAGEPFPTKHLRRLMSLVPQAGFSNIYGPAETNQCTFYHLPGIPKDETPTPIGRVWDETEYRIEEDGELLIHSSTLMRGYWEQPDLDAKAFHEEGGKRFYRTGDLVREDETGLLHFLGRKDRQVKIRGCRIELDEVETHLNAISEVREAATFPVPRAEQETTIAAAVILREPISESALIQRLGTKVPAYGIPHIVHFLEAFPRTATGKIDREALKRAVPPTD